MASAARTASRAFLRSTPATSSFRPAARSTRFALPTQAFRASSRRGYSTEGGPSSGSGPKAEEGPKTEELPKKSSNTPVILGLLAAGGAGVYFYLNGSDVSAKNFVPTQQDYQKVYDEIASRLDDSEYDDGSYGPVSRLDKQRCLKRGIC